MNIVEVMMLVIKSNYGVLKGEERIRNNIGISVRGIYAELIMTGLIRREALVSIDDFKFNEKGAKSFL